MSKIKLQTNLTHPLFEDNKITSTCSRKGAEKMDDILLFKINMHQHI